jgi:hypothetical protein
MNTNENVSKKTELEFDEAHYDMAVEDFDAEFISDIDWISIEEVAQEVMNQCWPSIVTIARDGFKKKGPGLVHINVKRYSAAIAYSLKMPDEAEAQYLEASSNIDCALVTGVSNYDPKKEFAFAVEFLEGVVVGTARIQRRGTRKFSKTA